MKLELPNPMSKPKRLEPDSQLPEIAFLSKSLSDENRLRILLTLRNEKKTVSKIVDEVNLSQSLVSHHLKELRRSLVVNVERKGLFVFYELADPRVLEVIELLSELTGDLLANRKTF
jgi:DNA-binding transcriptional ArsR family regulator